MLKAGGIQSFEVVLSRELEVLAILMGGGGGGEKSFHSLKGGCEKFYPVSRRAQKVSDP